MSVAPGERTLAAGASELAGALRVAAAVDGSKLVKTYTFKRGEYTIAVKHEFSNQAATPITPQLYLQLARDGNPPEGESSFYFTFTGPAIYTEASKFQKVDFKDIAKGKRRATPRAANDGWVAMVQHYFASAWLVHRCPGRASSAPPRSPTTTTPSPWCCRWARWPPGRAKTYDATLFAGPQEENKLAALAPGLELVKDYGWLTVLAKPLFWLLTQLHAFIGNWGWAIVALVVLLKIAFYWLNASAYEVDGQDEGGRRPRSPSCASATRTSRSRCSRR